MTSTPPRAPLPSRRILLLVLLPLVAAFTSLALQVWVNRTTLSRALDATLAEHTATLRAACEESAGRAEALRGLFERLERSHAVAIRIVDEHGNVLEGVGELDLRQLATELRQVIATGGSAAVEVDSGRAQLVHVERVDFRVGEAHARGVVVAHDRTDESAATTATMALSVAAAAVVLLAAAAVSLRFVRQVASRLGELVDASVRVASGDLTARADESPLAGLEQVSRGFNSMIGKLDLARAELAAESRARLEMDQRFRHAEALAIVGQVASSFAHEIGSPLNTILGWARLGEGDDSIPSGARESFGTISRQCERIQRIVERVLQVARPHGVRRETVDAAEVVDEVVAFLRQEARANGIELRVTASAPAIVRADRDELLEITLNLVVNAIHAQPGGGAVHVRLASEGEWVTLAIADAGPGVPQALREKIFTPFFTTKTEPSRPGTGLGLAIVAQIARDLGGKVELGTASEGGALFVVTLPRATTSPEVDA